jgi:1-deoxyxylulose-5-phosphate synthase
MKYQQLGRSGLLVSRTCLGTMTFGNGAWGCDAAESKKLTDAFIAGGGNFIDTADLYANTASESILGDILQDHNRDSLVVATKCWFPQGEDPNARGLSRRHIISACEASLRRLKTDYIDLYQFHGPDPYTPIDESVSAMADLIRAGKVRYAGLSNFHGWQVVQANVAAKRAGITGLISGQYLFNLLRRDIERDILPACRSEGLGVICWSPLASGFLSGKYRGLDQPPAGSRFDQMSQVLLPRFWNEQTVALVERMATMAEELSESIVAVALAWCLAQPGVTSVIAGASKLSHLAPQLRAAELTLPDTMLAELNAALPCDLGYPQDWFQVTGPGTFPADYIRKA